MDNINKQIRDIIESGNIGEYLPEFLYHATFSGSLDSIKENGLGNFGGGYKSPWSLSYDRGVYLDTDEGSAESFVEGSDDDRLDTEEVIILKIPTDKLTKSLVEIDFNNDWNMDMLDEIEFNAIEDYFSSITYFYDGVIPFADLIMVGGLNEDIDHREVYKSLTFSESPKRGPIFISKDGMFVNMGEEEAHSRIFGSEDEYEADDYYILHDTYGLIKANSGNQIEPYPYIDIWEVPNPAQKEAIITWMYKLIEWDSTSLMVNTSQDNEIYDLTKMIPEDVYRDIIRQTFSTKEGIELEEGKKDEQNLIKFAGEELAKRFLEIRQKLKSPENDFYYWIKNKTPEELEDFLNEKEITKSSTQIKRDIKEEGAEFITEGNGYKVYKIKTHEASCLYGSRTKWCISSKKRGKDWNYFDSMGDFYFFIGNGHKYALLHLDTKKTNYYNSAITKIKNINKEKDMLIGSITSNFYLFDEQDKDINYMFADLNLPKIPNITLTIDIDYKGVVILNNAIIENKNLYVVDSDVNIIGVSAFRGKDVKKVVLPEGLIEIRDFAFYNCKSLESINIPKTMHNSKIGYYAFKGCDNIVIEVPRGVNVTSNYSNENEFLQLHTKRV